MQHDSAWDSASESWFPVQPEVSSFPLAEEDFEPTLQSLLTVDSAQFSALAEELIGSQVPVLVENATTADAMSKGFKSVRQHDVFHYLYPYVHEP